MAGRRVLRIEIGTLEKALWRNYKNVRRDVRALEALGIVERDDAGRVLVPWDEVEAHLRIAA